MAGLEFQEILIILGAIGIPFLIIAVYLLVRMNKPGDGPGG